MNAKLVPLDGSAPLELQKDLVLIGRQANCDVRIDHKTVSKIHCVLVKTDGLLLLRDLGSTNGCRVNGQRIKRAALLPNDILAVAGCEFRVLFGPEEGKPANGKAHRSDTTELIGPDQPEANRPGAGAEPDRLPWDAD